MATRAAIVTEAKSWRQTPWIHQAGAKGAGTDCLGLIAGVGCNVGLPGAAKWRSDERTRNYARQPDIRLLLKLCDEYLDPIAIVDVALGDILLMRFANAPQHFAIVSGLDPMRIVHAYTTVGRVVETGLGGGWDKRIVRAYRYRGVEDEPKGKTGLEKCIPFGEPQQFSGSPRL